MEEPNVKTKYFAKYSPYSICSRCKMSTEHVTRTMCDPGGSGVLSTCREDPKKGRHLHLYCARCSNEWVTNLQPVPERMFRS